MGILRKMPRFKKTSEEEKELKAYYNYVTNFRKKYIPEEYNQCELLYDLPKKDLTHFISISNRSDGKTLNYIHFFVRLALDYDLKFALVARHWTLRQAMIENLIDIFDKFDGLEQKDLMFKTSDAYVKVYCGTKNIGVIYDLNKSVDLKNSSNFIKHFPILIVDEFLVLESHYVADEYFKLKDIYRSVDRSEQWKLIGHPVIFYLGNAVNFSSPILAGLKMFNILEKHPINTKAIYGNKILENRFNEAVNEKRNTNAFDDDEGDSMLTGQFKVNEYSIANEDDKRRIGKNKNFFFVKLKDEYLKVTYNIDTFECYLSLESFIPFSEPYQFNLLTMDNTNDSTFLKQTFFSENHIKKYQKGLFLFDNSYTKNMITDNVEYSSIKINSLINYYHTFNYQNDIEQTEKVMKDNYIQQTLKNITNKFLGGI